MTFKTDLFELKLRASKSTTDIQDLHVKAQIQLTRENKLVDLNKTPFTSKRFLFCFFKAGAYPHVKYTASV